MIFLCAIFFPSLFYYRTQLWIQQLHFRVWPITTYLCSTRICRTRYLQTRGPSFLNNTILSRYTRAKKINTNHTNLPQPNHLLIYLTTAIVVRRHHQSSPARQQHCRSSPPLSRPPTPSIPQSSPPKHAISPEFVARHRDRARHRDFISSRCHGGQFK